MISILIVDDDLNKISSIISVVKAHYADKVDIRQASCVQDALFILQNEQFHLLVTDLFMPLRNTEPPNQKGGEVLIRELYKSKNKANTPIYIVGLTQFDDIQDNFSGVWKVWKFESDSDVWRNRLRDLIFHISKIDSKIVKEKKETIFVEGKTDKDILFEAFELFYPDYTRSVSIESVRSSGGASWVERQIIIWAKTLYWKNSDKSAYLRAVGLFDNDEAGAKAIASIRGQISEHSAESKTFLLLKLDRKYSRVLIDLYKHHIDIPITIEELYSPLCWDFALKQGWLTDRNQTTVNNENCSNLPSPELRIITKYKVKPENKVDLVKYVQNAPRDDKVKALDAFKPLLSDILRKLGLIPA